MYREVSTQLNFPELEKDVLKFWEENDIFEKSVAQRDPNKPFVFYEGPPTANGRPGIHHVISRTIKDFVCRYKTMQGYRVERKAGWDTHGLPVEIEIEKELKLDGKDQIEKFGVAEFNERCKESVFRYRAQWDDLTRRIAFWVDLKDAYITYSHDYVESVWWILNQFWQKGLIYRGYKVLPYCPRCETPLSSHEVSQGYKDVEDPSIYVRVQLADEPDTNFLVWTTTPWTLISNVALAVNPDMTYVKVAAGDEKLILAEARQQVLNGDYEVLEYYSGKELLGKKYNRIFDFCPVDKDAFYLIPGDFVTTEDGTGIVHIAPAFGDDDSRVGQQNDLPVLQPVDKNGHFTEEVTSYRDDFVKDADPRIIEDLKKSGALYRAEQHLHAYPHCWRCDFPLLYYARKSWYVRTTQFKEQLIENNATIDWYPKEVGDGRFGEWLKNNVDWALSRDRFWGTPLNIWVCDECGSEDSAGSIAELKEKAGVDEIEDVHKPYIDELTFTCSSCQGTMRRTPEVIDAWFDSGSMPYAQYHYPFENRERFDQRFPADFIAEGIDQTRGWFYSLLAISTLLFDKSSYKSCVVNELILDKNGQKMSKSRGNAVDPFQILDQHGADPLRWYLLSVSPPWAPTRFDKDDLQEVIRKFYGTLTNVYAFFVMYANIDGFDYEASDARVPGAERAEIDRWIMSALTALAEQVGQNMERYDVTKAVRALSSFVIDDLSNWYVRRCRRRFWKSDMGPDKLSAFQTLYEALVTISRLMAPFSPFVAESIYQNLVRKKSDENLSVHLTSFPVAGAGFCDYRDEDLDEQMRLVREVVLMGRSLRNEAGLKIRQPLKRMIVAAGGARRGQLIQQMGHLIQEEINVKAVEFADDPGALMIKRALPQFKKLGPRFGRQVNEVAEGIKRMNESEIQELEANNSVTVNLNGDQASIHLEDVEIVSGHRDGLVVDSSPELTVALDTVLSDALIDEGLAREFINKIQNLRKDSGFEVIDRIRIQCLPSARLHQALQRQESYVKSETLAGSFEFGEIASSGKKKLKVNEEWAEVQIDRL